MTTLVDLEAVYVKPKVKQKQRHDTAELDEPTEEDDPDEMQKEQLTSWVNRINQIRKPTMKYTPSDLDVELIELDKELSKASVSTNLRRNGVLIVDEKKRRAIAEAAQFIARDKWPDYVLTGLKVLCILGGVALCVCTHGAAVGILAVPVVIPKAVSIGLSVAKDVVKIAQAARKAYLGWNLDLKAEGVEELEKMIGGRLSDENLDEYRAWRMMVALRLRQDKDAQK